MGENMERLSTYELTSQYINNHANPTNLLHAIIATCQVNDTFNHCQENDMRGQ